MPERSYITRTALVVALGGFLMGFDASVISGVVGFIERQFELTSLELGWAVSSLTLTATLAMMAAGPLSDAFGRRRVLFFAATLYAISAVASALAPSFWFLVAARMIGGFGVGASLLIPPMYIAEISPPDIRGRMVSFNQLNIVIGISVAFFTNYLILKLGELDMAWVEALRLDPWNWRWMLGLETFPAVLYFSCLFLVPESPRWLIMRGREADALPIMARVSGEQNAAKEIAAVKDSIARDEKKEKVPLAELFAPALRLVLLIGVVVAVIQQITGINAVFFYAPMIFEQSGIGTNAAFVQAILVGLTNLVFTVLAMMLIDFLGRKLLLVVGLGGMTVSLLVLAFGFFQAEYTLAPGAIASLPEDVPVEAIESMAGRTYSSDVAFNAALADALGEEAAKEHESTLVTAAIDIRPGLILAGILGFVAFFAVSIGPVMWVLFSELFPNRIRGLAISFVGLINSGVSFLVQLAFPWELDQIGSAPTFLIYGIFAAVGFVFVMAVLPETKGKSLEELEQTLVK